MRTQEVGLLAVLLCLGCVSVPPGTQLGKATAASTGVSESVWIAPVTILDNRVGDRLVVGNSLGLNLARYVRERAYFTEANSFPGYVKPEDLVLRFEFHKFSQERSVHPLYFPAAFFTATLYIWLGGPIAVDTIDLAGCLTVEDAQGSVLAESKAAVEESHNVSFWSADAYLPSGLEGRTKFIEQLLSDAVQQLAARKEINK